MDAVVRFYGVVGPRCEKLEYWWPDICYSYAMELRYLGLRFLPIGGAHYGLLGSKSWKHWRTLNWEMAAPLRQQYVNVVCAPPGMPLGAPLRGDKLAPKRITGIGGGQVDPRVLSNSATEDHVYCPENALHGLLTVGVRNIAITSCHGSAPEGDRVELTPTSREMTALKQYDAVITPHVHDAERLVELGLPSARECNARQFGREAGYLPCISEVLDS